MTHLFVMFNIQQPQPMQQAWVCSRCVHIAVS